MKKNLEKKKKKMEEKPNKKIKIDEDEKSYRNKFFDWKMLNKNLTLDWKGSNENVIQLQTNNGKTLELIHPVDENSVYFFSTDTNWQSELNSWILSSNGLNFEDILNKVNRFLFPKSYFFLKKIDFPLYIKTKP